MYTYTFGWILVLTLALHRSCDHNESDVAELIPGNLHLARLEISQMPRQAIERGKRLNELILTHWRALDVPRMVASLVELVRLPSVTGTDAESELQRRQAGSLADLGFDVDEWKLDLDALRVDPEFPGTEAPRTEGYGVAATYGGEGVPALALQGHVDVVPTGDLQKWPERDPFSGRIVGDVLHGRGACDMKAGVTANLAVARAVVSSGVRLERAFAIHAVVSEEDGGLGAFATMRRGHTAEAAVITEPTSGAIVTANAGALTFAIEVPGRAAHGSTRLEGVSAFEAFLPSRPPADDHMARRPIRERRAGRV